MYEAYDYGNEFAYNDYFYQPAIPYQTQAQIMPATMPAYQTYPTYAAAAAPAATSYPQVYYDEPPKVYQIRRTLYQPPQVPVQQQQPQVYSLQPQVQAYYGNQPIAMQAAQQPVIYQTTTTPQTTATIPRVYQANPTTTISPTRIAYTQPIQQPTTAMPITSMRSPYPQRATLPPVQVTQAAAAPARLYNGYY